MLSRRSLIAPFFIILSAVVAFAQSADLATADADAQPARSLTLVQTLTVTEIAPGTSFVDERGLATRYGRSFLGSSSGNVKGQFLISLNDESNPFVREADSDITGGVWAMPIAPEATTDRDPEPDSLYGTIHKGKISADPQVAANVQMELIVTGGTGRFAGAFGTAIFEGKLGTSPDGRPAIKGKLTVDYSIQPNDR